MIQYLSQGGPTHPKHGGGLLSSSTSSSSSSSTQSTSYPIHPIISFFIHYSIAIPCIFIIHDTCFQINTSHHQKIDYEEEEIILRSRQIRIARFIAIYTFILFTTRFVSSFNAGRLRQHAVLYELTWLCNSTLVMGFITLGAFHNNTIDSMNSNWLFRRRPLVAIACCIGVSIDQVLWYVDLLGILTCRKFPVGVMKYLTWKQTLWIDRLTCTHHLWTMPLIIYATKNEQVLVGLDAFLLSSCIVTIKVVLSRWLTPHCIQVVSDDKRSKDYKAKQNDPQRFRYLNVNLCHELWRDISFSFLQISHDNPPGWLYLWRLLWRWQVFNFLVFVAILSPLSRIGL